MDFEIIFPGVFKVGRQLATRNLVPGEKVYGEKLVSFGDGQEYRVWDIYRSKLAGAIKKGLEEMPIKPGSTVLYLGAATGTTVSHVSDITGFGGAQGGVVAVEFAQRSVRELLRTCKNRENVIPIMGDARNPHEYENEVSETCGKNVDVVYQDVSQQDQAGIFLKNCDAYLKKGGHGMLCIKSQSIDVSKRPGKVYDEVICRLEKGGLETLQKIDLAPYDREHMFWVGRKG